MDILIIPLSFLVILALSSIPALLILKGVCRKRRVKVRYAFVPSMLFAFITGFALNLELEGGIFSLPFQLTFLITFWALIVSFVIIIKFRYNKS